MPVRDYLVSFGRFKAKVDLKDCIATNYCQKTEEGIRQTLEVVGNWK